MCGVGGVWDDVEENDRAGVDESEVVDTGTVSLARLVDKGV